MRLVIWDAIALIMTSLQCHTPRHTNEETWWLFQYRYKDAAFPIMKIRRSHIHNGNLRTRSRDRPIFIMESPYLETRPLYWNRAPYAHSLGCILWPPLPTPTPDPRRNPSPSHKNKLITTTQSHFHTWLFEYNFIAASITHRKPVHEYYAAFAPSKLK